MSANAFPPGFLFGAATSAYQIEGGWDADGKGPSIWDHFARLPGRIQRNHNGDVACNTYFDFATDIDIMRRLGLQAYRFSVAWARVLPLGRGAINEKGLDYYDRLVDALLAAGIKPFVTLFHWDLPLALQREMGGFDSRDCAAIFADYAEIVGRRLGDRVKQWITLNEPWVHATLGHLRGLHAPGRLNPWAYLRVIHHQLLGHGLAAAQLKGVHADAQVGISLNMGPVYPATDSEVDRAAAGLGDQFINRIFLDPLFRGQYPEPLWGRLRAFRPPVQPGDMETIAHPLDFVGINYYTRIHVRHAWYVPFVGFWPNDLPVVAGRVAPWRKNGYSQMGWEVYPAGLFELLFRMKQEYGNPAVYITENGAAFADTVSDDGRVHDPQRQQFLEQHTDMVSAAARAGVNVRGYFAWSLIDNFEWAYGYDKRFGIVYVDFATQRRIIKDSGYWYQSLIQGQAAGERSGAATEP
ncbi:GH1 family beta-glucosidase [Promineifilum sp.]|uniref:GH1 family beta-glucosidase n=1 Tax=Promineifilum sp. TaxID=2664178 RepID=UPI0035B1E417